MFNFLIHVCAYRLNNDANLWVLLSYSTLEVLSIGLILFFIVTGGCFMALTVSAIINGVNKKGVTYQCSIEIII
jgi:hypothetical protein